ncbi:thiamine pyrophosphate-binding protein, partial [Rhizobium leguminosarum]
TLPEDILRDEVEAPRARHYASVDAHPGSRQIDYFYLRLLKAERPMVILGGTRWDADAVSDFQSFAERFQLPVGCSFRLQMLFDQR